jgi:hypothetical protein
MFVTLSLSKDSCHPELVEGSSFSLSVVEAGVASSTSSDSGFAATPFDRLRVTRGL